METQQGLDDPQAPGTEPGLGPEIGRRGLQETEIVLAAPEAAGRGRQE